MIINTIKISFCLLILLLSGYIKAQTIIAFQGFEGSASDNWTYVSPTQATGNQQVLVGAGNYGLGYAHTGNNSCRAGGGSTDCGTGSANCLNNATSGGGCTNLPNSTIVTFDTIDISCYTNVQIEVWHRSNTVCVGAGFDASDNLKFEVSINGGAWTQVGLMSSANNHTWNYTDLTAGTNSIVANPYIYSVPLGTYSIAFRTNAIVNRTDEVYYIDDVKITGTPSSLSIPVLTVVQPVCSAPIGSIEIVSPNFNGFTYSIDSVNFNNTNGIFTNLTLGSSYFVQVQSPAGCFSPVITVEIDSVISSSVNATITALGSSVICIGDSVVLESAIGNASYQWLFNGVAIFGANISTFTAFNQGNYQVLVSDSSSCFDTSAVINVSNGLINPPILNSSNGSLSFCNGDSLLLFVPNLFDTYQWLLNGVVIPNANDTSLSISSAGNYQLIVADTLGCSDSSNVLNIVIYSPNPAVVTSSTGSFSICANQQLTISVPSIYNSYEWYNNNNLIIGLDSSSITINSAGNYFATTVSINGCIDTSAVVEVIVHQLPVPIITPSDSIICEGQTVTFQTSSYNSYQWYYNNLPIGSANVNNYVANQSGNYSVNVLDNNGCGGSAIQATLVIDSLTVSIAANALNYCFGDTALLIASGNNFINLMWSNNVVGNSFQTVLPGIYTVTATSQQGCTAIDTFNLDFANRITINILASDTVLTCDQSIELNVSGADSYFWEPATGLSDQNSSKPIIEGITNSILFIVTGKKGNCSAVDSVNIEFEACSDIYIPNAFSPNGDGVNDIFRVLGSNIKEFNFKIYNRWGALLFESGQIDIGWDGKYNDKDVTAGVYVWLLDAKDADGKILNFNGNFSGNFSLFR